MIRWLDEPRPVPGAEPPGADLWLGGLPSGESAEQLVAGDVSGGLPKVVLHTAVRGGLVGLGLYAAGMRGAKNLVKFGLAGAVGIEVFVLLWALYESQYSEPRAA